FGGLSTSQEATIGPAAAFRVAGNFIRQHPSGNIVARYEHHHWCKDDEHFSRYECIDRVHIHFEDTEGGRTQSFGPFSTLLAADGTLYADKELFARFSEETVNWHCYPLETYWPVMVIESADPPSSTA